MKLIIILTLFISSCLPVYSGETDEGSSLKKGRLELERKNYTEAIRHLTSAEREFPLLGDYALLWLSDAYHEAGNHSAALDKARELLREFPDSPLLQKARVREIKVAEELQTGDLQKLFESFLKDYPEDSDMKYLYAGWLKNNNEEDRAGSFFREIYIAAGPLAQSAYRELSATDITVGDMLQRSKNLIRRMDYKTAEADLRSVLDKSEGSQKKDILRNLGLSLFRQKKYPEAAGVYSEVNEKYWEIRSLYRAGKKETIGSAFDDLLKSRDRRIGSILTAYASDKRREGRTEEAIRLYRKIMDSYPSEKEDVLWAIGWTHFRAGDYREAHESFSRLYDSHKDPKYLYWKARSLEAGGKEAADLYQKLLGTERNFYSTMTYARLITSPDESSVSALKRVAKKPTPVRATPARQKNPRVEALSSLGFTREALAELIHFSRNVSSWEETLYACSRFEEFGNYSYSVRLAAKAPYSDNMHQFLYPRAYWVTVDRLSKKYELDPYLVLSVMREESRFDPNARSFAGALGLMQLMPRTASRLDNRLGLGADSTAKILNVQNNLHLGIYYLSRLVKEFGSYTYAVAAYNAGEEAVKRWRSRTEYQSADEFVEDIPYAETRNYVKKVMSTFFEYKRISSDKDGGIEIPLEKL
jgi:soluble lytic murein transglycosylase